MIRARGRLLLVAGLLAAAAGAWWLIGGRKPPTQARPAAGEAPTSQFRGVELVDTDADGTRWRVSAEEGAGWEADGTGELKGIQATFEKKGKSIRLSAARGRIEARDEVRLTGGVSLYSENYEVSLDEAVYHRGEGRVVSDGPVTLRGPGLVARGVGLEVDVGSRRARVRAKVSAVLGGNEH